MAHCVAPEKVSELLPVGIFALSRFFMWPAFPRAKEVVLPVVLGAQALLFTPPDFGVISLILMALWWLISVGGIIFFLANDLGHVFARIRRPLDE